MLSSWENVFHWTGTSGAEFYQLEVYDASEALVYGQWYTDGICTALDCAVSPAATVNLGNGEYKWKVRTYGVTGFGSWTDFTTFTLNVPTLTLIAPEGTLTSWNNTFHWTGTSGAEFYRLEVYDSNDTMIYGQWYTDGMGNNQT
jgi:hypothetical protein